MGAKTHIALPCGNTSSLNIHLPRNRFPQKVSFPRGIVTLKFRWFAGICILCTLLIFLTKDPSTVYDKIKNFDEKREMKYILLYWRSWERHPFRVMGEGQEQFLKRRCPVNNCFITANASLLNSMTDFDAILFYVPQFSNMSFPLKRSLHQKYVFASRESSANYPLDSKRYDGIFNWTYTYKLNSDIYFGYVIIKNKKGEIIGPKQNMHWLEVKDMKAVDSDFRNKLKSKRLAAAWFVSNCRSKSRREKLGLQLQKELAKHELVLDIYSLRCKWKGIKFCPKQQISNVAATECLRKIETDYYFYLSFENSLSDDYVTEKLLYAVQNYAVPIVYGGANYTRFLPEGSYLDISRLGTKKTVKKIVESIKNKEMYYDFFKWTNHYSYHGLEETPEVDYICTLCGALNDANFVKQISIYKDIRKWWRFFHHNLKLKL